MSKVNIFNKKDGSKEQRAYDLYNEIKHCGSNIKDKKIKGDLTIPVWLSNCGFNSLCHTITFNEFSELIGDAAKLADEVQDPIKYFESIKKQKKIHNNKIAPE